MLRERTLYSLRDISIIPAVVTDITSRKECYPYRKSIEGRLGFYPLIASPMDSVVNLNNWIFYWKNNVSCIIPRTIPQELIDKHGPEEAYFIWLNKRISLCNTVFCAFSLNEVKEYFIEKDVNHVLMHVLIDIANGSMQEEINVGIQLREKYKKRLILMGGNIGNPQSYLLYDAAGFDFLRIGVGSGNGCLTSTNTAIHYPYASLISEVSELKYRSHCNCKIIADGGMSGYADIIKSLALGADYVMCGRIFAQATTGKEQIGDPVIYHGMSTKEAQKAMGSTTLKTAEGRSVQTVKQYTLSGWVENFDSYLRSAMSYCDAKNLQEFREKAICQVISPNSSSQINDK